MSKFGFTIDKNFSLPIKALGAAVAVASTATAVVVGTIVGASMAGAMVVNTALGSLATTCVWASGKLGFSPNRSLNDTSNIIMPNFIQIKLRDSEAGTLVSSQKTKKDEITNPMKAVHSSRYLMMRNRAEYKNAGTISVKTPEEQKDRQEEEAQDIEYFHTRGF